MKSFLNQHAAEPRLIPAGLLSRGLINFGVCLLGFAPLSALAAVPDKPRCTAENTVIAKVVPFEQVYC